MSGKKRKGSAPPAHLDAPPSEENGESRQHLRQVGGRPPLRHYLTQLWGRREFTLELATSRFVAQNEDSRLGSLWILLSPLIQGAVYGTVFYFLLHRDTRPGNFIAFVITGIFIFHFMSSCLNKGARAITGNLGLVRTVRFPRAVLPISMVLTQIFELIPTVLVLLPIVVITGEPLQWEWALLVPALIMCSMFSLGITFMAACLTVYLRDFLQLLPYLTRVFFYTSGVFFSVDRMAAGVPWLHTILTLNPFNVYITLCRRGVMNDAEIVAAARTEIWVAGALWGVGTMVVGFILFWLAEERYGKE